MKLRTLSLCVALTACAAPAQRPATTSPAALPVFDGRPVHARPLDELATRYWDLASAQRHDAPPTLPADAGIETVREGFAPWLRRRAEGLRELGTQIRPLDQRSPDDAVFASVLYATVAEELRDAVRALPAPPGLSPDAVRYWNETRDAQVLPLARHARDAWHRCVDALPRAAAPLQAWSERCASRERELGEAIANAPRPSLPAADAGVARTVAMPAECEGPEITDPPRDPDAPPPNERATREIAVVYADDRFRGPERAQLVTQVRQWIARIPGARLVTQNEVDAAQFLSSQRRWRVGGPVCGQRPPVPALLATRHTNLVIARVSTWCGSTLDETPDAGSREICTLSVDFDRAGTDDRTNLPPYRAVDVTGATGEVTAWVEAARRLSDPDAGTAMGGLLGSLMGGPNVVYRVLGYADLDPWLRVGPTLNDFGDGSARAAIGACATREGGIGSYRATWTISVNGAAQDVTVTPVSPPGDGSAERVAGCVREALGRVAFPCPRSDAPARVSARICVGYR